mgnify:FL=1|jgi:hypothetical protein
MEDIEKYIQDYGTLLFYNSPNSIIISRNKIASRVTDAFWSQYIRDTFKENIEFKLTGTGEEVYINQIKNQNVDTEKLDKQEWMIDQFIMKGSTSDIATSMKMVNEFTVKATPNGIVLKPAILKNSLVSVDDKKHLKRVFDSKCVTELIELIQKIYLESVEEAQKLIEGKSKKKVTILYREPKNRIVSGVIQDFFDIFNNQSPSERFWFEQFIKSSSPIDYPYLTKTFTHRENSIPSGYYGKTVTEEKILFSFVKSLCKDYLEEKSTWRTDNHSGPYLEILREVIAGLDSKLYQLVNIDFNREQVDAKLKGKRVDIHSVLRKSYDFDIDKEIKNEDDTLDKRTGDFHNSNDYWKRVLVDIIEHSPRIADLIKTETLIYWRLSNHKANIFKIDESD